MSPLGDSTVESLANHQSGVPLDATILAALRKEMVQTILAAEAAIGQFHCRTKAWCMASTEEGATVAVIEDGRMAGIGCELATIVIAPRARFDECRSGALLINGRTLKKTGSLEVHVNGVTDVGQWRIVAAMANEDRPWSRHRSYDWRSGSFDRSLPAPVAELINGSGE